MPPTHDRPEARAPSTAAGLRTRPWWRLRFPVPMEAAYAQCGMRARSRRVDACNLLGSACFWPLTAADAAHSPQIAGTIDAYRAAVTVLLFFVTLLGIWRRPRRRPWELDASITIGVAAIAASGLVLSRMGGGLMSAATAGGLSLMLMFCAVVVRQQFRHAAGVAAGIVVGYAWAVADLHAGAGAMAASNLHLVATTASLAVFANFMLERRDRRSHVLRLCEGERQAALMAGMHTLQRLSHCDALTGLANRRHFDRLVEQAWLAAGRAGWVGLLLLDIDHFKRHNDRYGHPAGDACLTAVAKAVDEVARRHAGIAARIGGEEFAVLLPHGPGADTAAVADALCVAVRRLALPNPDADAAPIVTVSVGAAAARPGDGRGYAHFQDAADQALYRAKAAGRDRWLPAEDGPPPAEQDAAGAFGPFGASASASASGSGSGSGSASGSGSGSASASASDPAAAPSDLPTDFSATMPPDAERDAVAVRLRAALDRRGLRLRFSPDLEAAYDRAWRRGRGQRLCVQGAVGVAYVVLYQRLGSAVFGPLGPVADALVQTVAVAVASPLLLLALLPMRSWLRESLFGTVVVALGLCLPLIASVRPNEQAQTYALALFLLPMFCAAIAEQPWLATLLPSLVVFGAATWLLRPVGVGVGDGAAVTVWAMCTGYRAVGTGFALIAAYLLERSTRRHHLLTRLDEVEGAALQAQTDRLEALAMVDPVTGIANRRLYDSEQSRLWLESSATGRPLALLLLDVDHFKQYNDLYGHPAGDACLRSVAHALVRWANERSVPGRAAPLPARIGGEEFGVLLPGYLAADALREGESLCAAVADLAMVHGDSPIAAHLSVSIGVTSMAIAAGSNQLGSTALLAAADAALYRAKSAGRNRACL